MEETERLQHRSGSTSQRKSLTIDLSNLSNVLEELLPTDELLSPSSPALHRHAQTVPLTNALASAGLLAPSSGRRKSAAGRARLCRKLPIADGEMSAACPQKEEAEAEVAASRRASSQLAIRQERGSSSSAQTTSGEHASRSVLRQHARTFERFRWQLLQRFRSLADAFSRLHDLTLRENSLAKPAFIRCFAQLGIPEAEGAQVFDVMDFKGTGCVSLALLHSSLSTSSRQSLLWELRCQLLAHGITPFDFSKVQKILAVARRPRHRTVRQQRHVGRSACRSRAASQVGSHAELDSDADSSVALSLASLQELTTSAPNDSWSIGSFTSSTSLSRRDWLAVCAAIGLSLPEAEKLFKELSNNDASVDLKEMFSVLRSGVAPHVSLERFAMRILSYYGSFQDAFAAISRPHGLQKYHVVRWPEFLKLAVCLDVQDDNAAHLWSVLTLAETARPGMLSSRGRGSLSPRASGSRAGSRAPSPSGRGEAFDSTVSEATFVHELAVWAPSSALDGFRSQVEELFHTTEELRRALEEAGYAANAEVGPPEIARALQAVGIRACNTEQLYTAASSLRRGAPRRRKVTLDSIINLMQGRAQADPGASKTSIRAELRPVWQQMSAMRASLSAPNLAVR